MDIAHVALLLATGVAGGVLSALIGGASIVTFPALLASGLTPLVATTTNSVALLPGNFIAAIYDRSQLPAFDRSYVVLVFWAVLGGIVGALLLLATSQRVLELLIPLLLGFATVLFAYAGRVGGWLRAQAELHGNSRHAWMFDMAALLPASIYGGYFGAGVGVIFLGVMSIWSGGDYRRANVIKNFVVSCNNLVAVMVYVAQGVVAWGPALIMMIGALAGGLIGARIAQVVPHRAMRVVATCFGIVLTAVFAWRYWF